VSRLGVGSPLRVSRQLQPLPSRIVTADVARQLLYVPVVINDLLPRRSVISRRPDVDEIPSGLYERPLHRYE